MTSSADADEAQDASNPVVTIADIFRGPFENGHDFGDEVSDPGSRIMMQDTPGLQSDPIDEPTPGIKASASDVALIEGVPVAMPPELVPDTDDDVAPLDGMPLQPR